MSISKTSNALNNAFITITDTEFSQAVSEPMPYFYYLVFLSVASSTYWNAYLSRLPMTAARVPTRSKKSAH